MPVSTDQPRKWKEQVAYHSAGQLAGTGNVSDILHKCIFCIWGVRMFAILCMGLPITTTTAGQWWNSLTFHNYIKCITDKWLFLLSLIMYVTWPSFIFLKKFLEGTKSFILYACGFTQHHMIGVTVCLHSFSVSI